MNRWTWADTGLTAAAVLLAAALLLTWTSTTATSCATPHTVPTDTVGCGGLVRCTAVTRPRWMSHHPFAAPSRQETR